MCAAVFRAAVFAAVRGAVAVLTVLAASVRAVAGLAAALLVTVFTADALEEAVFLRPASVRLGAVRSGSPPAMPPDRRTSRRSARTSSRSATERRSISMSQWVRGGLPAFSSGGVPSTISAVAPQTLHSQVAGTSASTENGMVKRWSAGHTYSIS